MKTQYSFRKIFFLNVILSQFLGNALGLLQASSPVSVENSNNESITITGAWIRPSNTETSAVYMKISNNSSVLDKLIAVQAEVCEKIELHRIEKHNGIFKMRPVQAIDIPAGSTTVLKPSGMHIMLMGLKKPLLKGEKVSLKLVFQNRGNINMDVDIKKISKEEKNSGSAEESMVISTCH